MGSQPSPRLITSALAAPQQPLSSGDDEVACSATKERAAEERTDALRHFDAAFSEGTAVSAEDLKEAFRLRYLVYCLDRGFEDARSEEHTSELQSLMRRSYAVFCLKKKTCQKSRPR